MNLSDIAPLETWARIENEAYEKFNLQSSVFNVNGMRITDTKNWSNRICPEIKSTDKGQSFICATAHMNMANQARRTLQPVVAECDAGLVKIVVPIFVGAEFVGTAGGCGVLLDGGEVDAFAVHKIAGMDEEQVTAFSEGVPVFNKEKVKAINRFFIESISALVEQQ